MNDVVYILKRNIDPDELRYSLRSVDENFPCRKLWFVCGQPEGFKPDGRIVHIQHGMTKWERTRDSLLQICACDEITEDFFLFNDDFFVLKKQEGPFVNMVNGSIERYVNDIIIRNQRGSDYTVRLQQLMSKLKAKNKDTINYAVHMPMLMNRKLVYELICSKDDDPMFRSLYGNWYEVPYVYHPDCKIYDFHKIPDDTWDFVSTNEMSFKSGRIGEYLINRFPFPSRWEI